jgi:hypothetical protein
MAGHNGKVQGKRHKRLLAVQESLKVMESPMEPLSIRAGQYYDVIGNVEPSVLRSCLEERLFGGKGYCIGSGSEVELIGRFDDHSMWHFSGPVGDIYLSPAKANDSGYGVDLGYGVTLYPRGTGQYNRLDKILSIAEKKRKSRDEGPVLV